MGYSSSTDYISVSGRWSSAAFDDAGEIFRNIVKLETYGIHGFVYSPHHRHMTLPFLHSY